jgi:transketolase
MLNERSKQIRRDTIALSKANGGYHYGGCFSIVEMLAILYDNILTEDDKFVLSKGHACWPLYVLLREQGYDPKLEGHPSRDPYNGIHCSTGSLGHGLPAGIGMAMAKKLKGESGKVYVLMGDGECQEGTTWESMLIAAHHKLNNLVVIVDKNGIQGSGYIEEVLPINGLGEVARAIGWEFMSIDGHDNNELLASFSDAPYEPDKPRLIIANTVKGKGVSFMENDPAWHAKWPSPEEEAQILKELE